MSEVVLFVLIACSTIVLLTAIGAYCYVKQEQLEFGREQLEFAKHQFETLLKMQRTPSPGIRGVIPGGGGGPRNPYQ